MDKFVYFDGKKSFNVPNPWESELGWVSITGDNELAENELYQCVAAVFRAVNLTADATANLPFAVVGKNGDIDTSDDWQNAVGFMPNPRDLIRRWRTSLFMTNQAYAFMESERGKRLANLRYITPMSVTPKADSDGLVGFYRAVKNKRDFFRLEDRRIFYIFRMDYDVEVLPSDNTEFAALMNAAGVLYWADFFAKHFFERGGINPSMLMVKGVPQQAERERIENAWNKLRRNFYKFAGKIFNADSMQVQQLGNGLGDLKDNNVYQAAIQNVALASGMPLSLLLANSANYATAQIEYMQWYRDSLTPRANEIADALTEQIFAPLNMRFEFRPEQASPNQEEEVQRSAAWATFVDRGVPASLAAQIVGIDMPAGYEYADMDSKTEVVEETQQQEPVVVEEQKSVTLSYPQFEELHTWRGIATRKAKRGESLSFDFDVNSIPDNIACAVKSSLSTASSKHDVDVIFESITSSVPITSVDGSEKKGDSHALLALADAINRAANTESKSTKAEPMTVNINQAPGQYTISVPPATVSQPVVNVSVPEQPAPNVVVNNEVNPTPVTIDNSVTVEPTPVTIDNTNNVTVEPTPVTVENAISVQPADVVIPSPPKGAKVIRDGRGIITGLETE